MPLEEIEFPKRVSIKDIAQAAGVSHSTVSRALSDSPLVNDMTKTRIQNLAQQMGYSPDAIARSLVTQQTRTVGIVVTTITDLFVAEIVQYLEDVAHENGYSIILTSAHAEPEREIDAVQMLGAKRVDAIIVTSSRVGALYLEHLERIGVPIVLINNHNEQSGRYTFSVSVDNHHGGYLATAHLTQLGHSHIAYITGPAYRSDDKIRQQGYKHALAEANIDFAPDLVVAGTGRAPGGEQALAKLLDLSPHPTAILCYNDMTAIGVLRAARAAGLSIPGDLSVVGFDDIPFAAYVYPALTTIAQPKREIGRRAMQMALSLINNHTVEIESLTIKGRLIVRQSSGGIKTPT